ncbi:MAG: YgiT-type zinc finger protein [Nitrososphaerota archaeon]|jgi:YgiT-type zinc finger domain-containing protein|nr:YgiT-type zinc finger protein [Nitrososphaerota archaeon]
MADDKTPAIDKAKPKAAKAGALLCPICCIEYAEVTFDFEINGIVLHDVDALKCPKCGEEIFSPQQQEKISTYILNLGDRPRA